LHTAHIRFPDGFVYTTASPSVLNDRYASLWSTVLQQS
jgi:hypothetical protein